MKYLIAILIFVYSAACFGQNSHLFRTIYYPAEPFGGEKELKTFIKQEFVYPDSALQNGLEGEAFITFKVNSKGHVIYKEVAKNVPLILQKEASRIFDKIVWEQDPSRSDPDLGFEKLRIDFKIKKYQKLIKKRGYEHLPNIDNPYVLESNYYNINQVDIKPEFNAATNFNKFLKENFNYPNIALQQGISGRVTVEFIIEPYGLASNIRIKEAVGGGCNEETARLVRLMKWSPAMKNNKAVRCLYEYQLNFVNPGGSVR